MRIKYLPNSLENFHNISNYVTLPSIKFRNIYEIIQTIYTLIAEGIAVVLWLVICSKTKNTTVICLRRVSRNELKLYYLSVEDSHSCCIGM